MPNLLGNAVASIRMGVEDYRQQDADRDISAVRNFYAGVLLLAKEALVRAAPNADPQLVIGAKLKPVADGAGGIEMRQVGHSTVDFQQIAERAKDFGVALDHKALQALNVIRNDIEHHFTTEPETAVRAAISKGFPVVASLFRQLDENPLAHLGEAWTTMLSTKELYEQELQAARATLSSVKWYSPSINGSFKCGECQQEFVEQIDVANEDQSNVELVCKTCASSPDLANSLETALDDLYGADAYVRYKDASEDGPIYRCPACDHDTLIEGEDKCANCGESLDYESECARCGGDIPLQDFLDGLDGGLCSYCAYMTEKVMRED